MSKQALGKGLSALLLGGSDLNDLEADIPYNISLNLIEPGSIQPREYFAEEGLKELSESIKKNGVLQPIIVRQIKEGESYEIIAGERRFRAAKLAGLETIPVVIKNFNDAQALEIALIENIQRENLTPIEEAEGYKKLQEEFSYTQEQLGNVLGKSRSHVANMMRLLTLPQSVKEMINNGSITMGHARALINSENPSLIAEKIAQEGLTVRDIEKLVSQENIRSDKPQNKRKASSGNNKDEDLLALERTISENIGLKVTVEDSADGGRVILYFNNLTELDKILQKLG